MVLKYFALISNNNTMNPTFSPGPNTPYICKFTCYFVTRKYKKTQNFVTKMTFNGPSLTIHTKIGTPMANLLYKLYVLDHGVLNSAHFC